jgi:hypothetical protein
LIDDTSPSRARYPLGAVGVGPGGIVAVFGSPRRVTSASGRGPAAPNGHSRTTGRRQVVPLLFDHSLIARVQTGRDPVRFGMPNSPRPPNGFARRRPLLFMPHCAVEFPASSCFKHSARRPIDPALQVRRCEFQVRLRASSRSTRYAFASVG